MDRLEFMDYDTYNQVIGGSLADYLEFLKEVSEKYKKDTDIELELTGEEKIEFDIEEILKNPKQFQYLEKSKRNDKDIIQLTIKEDRSILQYIGSDAENNREFLLEIVRKYPDAIIYLNKYKTDDEFVKKALSSNGFLLESVDSKYKEKPEYVLMALKSSGSWRVLRDVPDNIINDREFIKDAILIDPNAIAITSFQNRDDEELATLAVEKEGFILRCISPRLQRNKEIVLKALNNNLNARVFIPKELYNDSEICLELGKLEKRKKYNTITSVGNNVPKEKVEEERQ